MTPSSKSENIRIVATELCLRVLLTLSGFLVNFLVEYFALFYPLAGSSAVQFTFMLLVVLLPAKTQ